MCGMVNDYLSENGFRKGLKSYLEKYAYANAETNDLWRKLGEASGKPVEEIMSSYTRQPGYPVIFVKEYPDSKDGADNIPINLEQKRFLFDGSHDENDLIWKIPVGFTTSKSRAPIYGYMSAHQMLIKPDIGYNDWIKFNPGHSALYRVAYTPRMWKLLADAVRKGELPEADRLGLLDDAFALSRAGYMKISDALNLLSAYKNEDGFYVWAVIAGAVGTIDGLLRGDSDQFRITRFAIKLFKPIAAKMGWDKPNHPEENPEILLRSLAIRNLGRYGDMEIITDARRRFDVYLIDGTLDPDIRQTVFSLICENGSLSSFDEMLAVYDQNDDHQEKIRVLRAMGSFKSPGVIQKVLAFSLSDKVRSQDTPILLNNVGANDDGRKPTWEFIKENWAELQRRYHGGGFGSVTGVLQTTSSGFITTEDLADVEKFFSEHQVPGTERAMAQSLETIRSNIAWRARDLENIREWLTKNT